VDNFIASTAGGRCSNMRNNCFPGVVLHWSLGTLEPGQRKSFQVPSHAEEAPRDKHLMGYLPRYLTGDVCHLLTGEDTAAAAAARVQVERVNAPPAPVHFRLLCRLEMQWAADVDRHAPVFVFLAGPRQDAYLCHRGTSSALLARTRGMVTPEMTLFPNTCKAGRGESFQNRRSKHANPGFAVFAPASPAPRMEPVAPPPKTPA
jgi:hypothetical protein